jgi:hypothetical protein
MISPFVSSQHRRFGYAEVLREFLKIIFVARRKNARLKETQPGMDNIAIFIYTVYAILVSEGAPQIEKAFFENENGVKLCRTHKHITAATSCLPPS